MVAQPFYANIHLSILRCSGTSDNLDQLSGDDGLTGTVEQDGEFRDHLTSVLRGVLFLLASFLAYSH